MEGHLSTDQSPQWAVVSMEEVRFKHHSVGCFSIRLFCFPRSKYRGNYMCYYVLI
jgi:hypothetical protein